MKLKLVLGKSGLKNLIWWGSRSLDAVKFLNTIGVLDTVVTAIYAKKVAVAVHMNTYFTTAITTTGATAVGAMVAGSAVILGNILFVAGCALKASGIYENAQKTYALRSVAYTITAWMFDKPQVMKSRTISKHPDDLKKYNKVWSIAQKQTLTQLPKAKFCGVSADKFKEAVKVVYGNDAGAFCLDVMRSLATTVPGKANRTAWNSHLQGGHFAVYYPR